MNAIIVIGSVFVASASLLGVLFLITRLLFTEPEETHHDYLDFDWDE